MSTVTTGTGTASGFYYHTTVWPAIEVEATIGAPPPERHIVYTNVTIPGGLSTSERSMALAAAMQHSDVEVDFVSDYGQVIEVCRYEFSPVPYEYKTVDDFDFEPDIPGVENEPEKAVRNQYRLWKCTQDGEPHTDYFGQSTLLLNIKKTIDKVNIQKGMPKTIRFGNAKPYVRLLVNGDPNTKDIIVQKIYGYIVTSAFETIDRQMAYYSAPGVQSVSVKSFFKTFSRILTVVAKVVEVALPIILTLAAVPTAEEKDVPASMLPLFVKTQLRLKDVQVSGLSKKKRKGKKKVIKG